MSDTRRNFGYRHHRTPRGSKQAKISEARSIPPNARDDKRFSASGEFYQPLKRYLESRSGCSWAKSRTYIKQKWGQRALKLMDSWVKPAYPAYFCGKKRLPYVDEQGILRNDI